MKRAAVFLAIVAIMAAPLTVLAAEPFSATLTPDAEVPVADCGENDCAGAASVTISDDESSIDFEVTFENLTGDGTATMSHIHYGPDADEAGPVMIWLTEHGVTDGSYESPLTGTATEEHFMPVEGGPQTFAEALDAIRAGDTYVNVHTEANPPGEVRGQLEALPDTAVAGDAAATLSPTALLVVLLAGAVAFVIGLRTFAFRRS
jgi:hypothetical protein